MKNTRKVIQRNHSVVLIEYLGGFFTDKVARAGYKLTESN